MRSTIHNDSAQRCLTELSYHNRPDCRVPDEITRGDGGNKHESTDSITTASNAGQASQASRGLQLLAAEDFSLVFQV